MAFTSVFGQGRPSQVAEIAPAVPLPLAVPPPPAVPLPPAVPPPPEVPPLLAAWNLINDQLCWKDPSLMASTLVEDLGVMSMEDLTELSNDELSLITARLKPVAYRKVVRFLKIE